MAVTRCSYNALPLQLVPPHDDNSFATHVSAMETEVRYKGDAVGTMILPEFRIESGQERLSMLANSQFTITNEQLWIAFVRDMLSVGWFVAVICILITCR